jgi:5-methylcytosine-specific restriction enzyme subunit McrC
MSLRATRPLILTERVRRVCRIAPADVAFLSANYPSHFELLPTGRRDWYVLTPGAVVGIVATPTRRIVIRPKIPLANLFYLLDPLSSCPALPDRSALVDGQEALAFLAGQFALRLRERVAAGFQRGYDEQEMTGPFLLGRLDVAAQMRDVTTHKEQLHCRHDAFTADILCNRALRSAAEVALASPLLRDEVRTALLAVLGSFAEVQSIPLTSAVWSALADAPAAYRPLLALGRFLADSLTPSEATGEVPGPAFLLNLEQVFEQFLTRLLFDVVETKEQRRARYRVVPQPLIRASVPVAGQPDLNVRPDVLLFREGAARRVIDAKWKRLAPMPLIAGDVYQMLAYCAALDVRRAVLVYPGRRDRAWRYALERGDCRIVIATMRVIGDREALSRSARRLTRLLLL